MIFILKCFARFDKGSHTLPIVQFFFNIVQKAFCPPPPPPLVLNIYGADFSEGPLKKCVNVCPDKIRQNYA